MSEARQNVARISLVRGGPLHLQNENVESPPMDIIADDYIIPSETILDYLTRFSGIIAEDLQVRVIADHHRIFDALIVAFLLPRLSSFIILIAFNNLFSCSFISDSLVFLETLLLVTEQHI